MAGLHLTIKEVAMLEAAMVGEVKQVMSLLYLVKTHGGDGRPWKGDIASIVSAHEKIVGAVLVNRGGSVVTTQTKNLLRDAAELFKLWRDK